MEQKRVSFKVAKAIKEAGYPQKTNKVYSLQTRGGIKEGDIIDCSWVYINTASIPTYIEVWLWLWREKNIRIHTRDFYGSLAVSESSTSYDSISHADPEEAIIAAIEYLVDNDLIK